MQLLNLRPKTETCDAAITSGFHICLTMQLLNLRPKTETCDAELT
jgi:hypothetical protein